VVDGPLDYSNRTIQAEIENLMGTLENTSYITSPLYSESWLRSFVNYVDRNQDYLNMSIDTEEDFIKSLRKVSFAIFAIISKSIWLDEIKISSVFQKMQNQEHQYQDAR
jgi:Patched family